MEPDEPVSAVPALRIREIELCFLNDPLRSAHDASACGGEPDAPIDEPRWGLLPQANGDDSVYRRREIARWRRMQVSAAVWPGRMAIAAMPSYVAIWLPTVCSPASVASVRAFRSVKGAAGREPLGRFTLRATIR